MDNLENAAKTLITKFSNFPNNIQDKMKQAYKEQRYQDVLNIAAAHDIRHRIALDSKVSPILNPDFVLCNCRTNEIICDIGESLTEWERDMIMFASRDAKTNWGEYKWNQGQQMYLYKSDAVPDEVFKTAAEAVDAYCLKNGIDRHEKSKRHQFTRHLVMIDEEHSEKEDSRSPTTSEGKA